MQANVSAYLGNIADRENSDLQGEITDRAPREWILVMSIEHTATFLFGVLPITLFPYECQDISAATLKRIGGFATPSFSAS